MGRQQKPKDRTRLSDRKGEGIGRRERPKENRRRQECKKKGVFGITERVKDVRKGNHETKQIQQDYFSM
jgi:hypothetical protein